jgi:hypothetical protein
MAMQVQVRQATCARVGEDQLAQRVLAVAGHVREVLQRDRDDAAARLTGPAHVEHAGLAIKGDVALQDQARAKREGGEVGLQLRRVAHELDAHAAAAEIGLGDHRQREAGPLQLRERGGDLIVQRAALHRLCFQGRPVDRDKRRDRLGHVAQRKIEDLRLRFADEAAAWKRRVGGRRQQRTAMLEHEPRCIERDRRVEGPHRPELVEAQRRALDIERRHALVRLHAQCLGSRQVGNRKGSEDVHGDVRVRRFRRARASGTASASTAMGSATATGAGTPQA